MRDPGVYAEQLWAALKAGDETRAATAVLDAVEGGVSSEAVLLDVIAATQTRVGTEWAANRLTVVQEHAITALNDRMIDVLSAHRPRCAPHRLRVVVACVDGEWHAMPARMLTEMLSQHGFDVEYLGAQLPTPRLISHIHRTGPELVALSGSLSTRLPAAHAAITACQTAGVPVLVGGAAFGADGRYAYRVGADLWAPDARSAISLLTSGTPLPSPAGSSTGLGHLSDQEYTMVARSTAGLVGSVFAAVERLFPAGYSALDRERFADELVHLVEFLGAALYVDDAGLFTDFVSWTAEVMSAREISAELLDETVGALTDQLRDFPRARGFLDGARRQLVGL
ncbi:cobalamin-binding protein [Pseudonocardiaceae bacterium YIM PH 21723]|nr:cobalamin-binding protein [Pseudonocardiaceae bacterium YIM PH 21723]